MKMFLIVHWIWILYDFAYKLYETMQHTKRFPLFLFIYLVCLLVCYRSIMKIVNTFIHIMLLNIPICCFVIGIVCFSSLPSCISSHRVLCSFRCLIIVFFIFLRFWFSLIYATFKTFQISPWKNESFLF